MSAPDSEGARARPRQTRRRGVWSEKKDLRRTWTVKAVLPTPPSPRTVILKTIRDGCDWRGSDGSCWPR